MNNNKILRKFGFKTDQNGIMNRYLRENGAWDEHLNNTKNFILQAAKDKAKGTAVMLGSGWLLDVPAIELSHIFDKVILVDIYHPRQIRHKLRHFRNIEFIDVDITGLAKPVYKSLKKRKSKPELTGIEAQYDNKFMEAIKNADFIASVNILNQLDILICDYIKNLNLYESDEINLFRNYIQSSHIQLLTKGKSTIITDYKEINTDESNNIISRKKLLYTDLPKNNKIEKWKWQFDQNKTYHPDCNTYFKVMAVNL